MEKINFDKVDLYKIYYEIENKIDNLCRSKNINKVEQKWLEHSIINLLAIRRTINIVRDINIF